MIYKHLQWLFRIFGVAPANSPADKYFTVLPLALSVFASIHEYNEFQKEGTGMLSTIWKINTTAYCGASLWFIIYNCCNRQAYTNILRDFAAVERELGTPPYLREQKIMFILFVAFCSMKLIMTLQMIISHRWLVEGRAVIGTLVLVPQFQYMVFVSLLSYQFYALNSQLSDIVADADKMPLVTLTSRLDSVFRLHTHLHVVVWDVGSHFCFFNLLSVLSRVSFFCLRMYEFLMIVSGNILPWNPIRFIMGTIGTLVFVAQCLLCHSCAREANRTVLLCHQLLQPSTSVQLWEQVGLFSRLALHNKVRFSVGGVFNLDRPFLVKVAMTALSYLIIAVQLKDVQPSNSTSYISQNRTI